MKNSNTPKPINKQRLDKVMRIDKDLLVKLKRLKRPGETYSSTIKRLLQEYNNKQLSNEK